MKYYIKYTKIYAKLGERDNIRNTLCAPKILGMNEHNKVRYLPIRTNLVIGLWSKRLNYKNLI